MNNIKINNLYLFSFFWHFGNSLVTFFIPFYLYNLNYSIHEILEVYLGQMCFLIPFAYLSGYIVHKIGYKYSFFISIFGRFTTLIILTYFTNFIFFAFCLSFFMGIGGGFSAVAKQTLYSNNTSIKLRGRNFSFIELFSTLGNFLGPIFAGILYLFFSFKILIIFAIIILFLSIFFLTNLINKKIINPIKF